MIQITTGNSKGINLEILIDDGSQYVLNEVFKKRCYDLVPFIGEVKTILDVGANTGIASAWFRAGYPAAAIHAFEPDPKALAVLQRNAPEIGGLTLHAVGLYNEDCSKDFFVGKTSTVHSSIHANKLSSEVSCRIELKDAGRFLRLIGVNSADILKIDTEGCEIVILRSLGEMVSGVKVIYLEFHSERDRRELDDMLSPTHQLYSGEIIQAHRGQFTYLRRDLLQSQIDPQIEALNAALR